MHATIKIFHCIAREQKPFRSKDAQAACKCVNVNLAWALLRYALARIVVPSWNQDLHFLYVCVYAIYDVCENPDELFSIRINF